MLYTWNKYLTDFSYIIQCLIKESYNTLSDKNEYFSKCHWTFFYKNKKVFAVIFDNIVYLNFINLQIFKLFL